MGFRIPERGLHVDNKDDHTMTLLQVASRHGHLDMVKLVINNGAAVESDIRADLYFSVIRGHASIGR